MHQDSEVYDKDCCLTDGSDGSAKPDVINQTTPTNLIAKPNEYPTGDPASPKNERNVGS